MSEGDASPGTGAASAGEQRGTESSDGGLRATAGRYLRKGAASGALAALGGGMAVLLGLRSVHRGERRRGRRRLLLGGVLVAAAVGQRRAASGRFGTGDDGTPEGESDGSRQIRIDEVGSQVSGGESATPAGDADDEVGPTAGATAQTAAEPDAEREGEPDPEQEGESDAEQAADSESTGYDRLDAAAFDEESARVPAPQRAFDVEYLVLGGEVYWGIRETDDVVVVSQLYDPMEDRGDERYVASSEVDDDRMVTIPDRILDHWDDVAGGGVAVESGDDVVFATAEGLAADDQLAVVPERWSEDVLGEGP